MQVLALGKWSKTDNRWNMVVALRRPESSARTANARPADRSAAATLRHPESSSDKR